MNDIIRAAREHNARASIHRISNEIIGDIFVSLSYIDTPSLALPQGWFIQVNGVCHLWREIAVHCVELWARSAGSFPSERMTDLAIERARAIPISFDGHLEDSHDQDRVLTEYQLSLIETHVENLRSFVHDDYMEWSDLFYRLKTFPKLELARIWDDSGPDMWYQCIEAPRLQSLYMNYTLVPFNAPSLRYLRVDMDNSDWRLSRDLSGTYEPPTEGCRATPEFFPMREFVTFLQRSPQLESLVITDMPLKLAEDIPSRFELRCALPKLRMLDLSGKSWALGDLLQRLEIPQETAVFLHTDYKDTDYIGTQYQFDIPLLEAVQSWLFSKHYDSLRLGMTPTYDLLIQRWSSEVHDTPDTFGHSTCLGLAESVRGSSFTLRIPVGTAALLKTFTSLPPSAYSVEDPFQRFQNAMGKDCHRRMHRLRGVYAMTPLKYFDLTESPYAEHYIPPNYDHEDNDKPDDYIKFIPLFVDWDDVDWDESPPELNMVLSWSLFSRLGVERLLRDYLCEWVTKLTIVNFPCAAFPSQKRYDKDINARAWSVLQECLEERDDDERLHRLSLTFAESTSDTSNMERSEEPEYQHMITESYEDAVRAVTEKGYQRIAPFVTSFEDLRVNTWP